MKDFTLTTETEKGTFDIVYIKAETLELAKEKYLIKIKKDYQAQYLKTKLKK